MSTLKSRFNATRSNDTASAGVVSSSSVRQVGPVVDLTEDMPLAAGPAPVQGPSQHPGVAELRARPGFLVRSAFEDQVTSDHQLLNWSFTIYPESIGSDDLVMDIVNRIGDDSKWAIFGQEVCPTTGRMHLQSFCIFKNRIRKSQLRKKYHISIHWEGAKGSPSQNYDYCTKEDKDPMEYGVRPQFDNNGEREKNRWDVNRKALKEGRIEDVDSQIFICHYRSCKAIMNDNMRVDKNLDVYPGLWLYGVPGSGKSWEARMLQESRPYVKKADKWWCNYNMEEIVVIEDMSPDHAWMINLLKCWTDVYPFPAEVKVGNLPLIRPRKIIITSNYSMAEVFASVDARDVDIKAIYRRFQRKYYPYTYDGEGQAKSFLITSEDEDDIKKVKAASLTSSILKTDGYVTPNLDKVGNVIPETSESTIALKKRVKRAEEETEEEDVEELPPGIPLRRSTAGMFNLACGLSTRN